MTAQRTAKEVIDDAIRENRFAEYLSYAFASLAVTVGVAMMIVGLTSGQTTSSVVGLVCTNLFWPAMSSARRTRKENISIRLLETSLANATTIEEAASAINKIATRVLSDGAKDG